MKKIIFACLFSGAVTGVQAQTPAFKRSFTNMTEVGGLFGRVDYTAQFTETVENRLSLTAQTFNGVQLRPRLAVGGTVGIDWYAAALLMPLCAGVRYDLARDARKSVRVFTSLDAGYGVAWLHQSVSNYTTTGGWVVSPGIGLRIGRPGVANVTLSMSYKRQEAHVEKPVDGVYTLARNEDRIYNRLAIRLGVAF